ncbi:MAG: phytoene desaturase family protein [Sporichthyaceae bacterium]
MTVDVAVVGAGHNALVAACYLARAGLDVAVLERDTVVGGAVSTVERFPGHRVDRGSSLHVMVRHTDLVEDLELGECGLRYLEVDPWGFIPAGAGCPGMALWSSLDRTVEAIAKGCGDDDARGYRALMDRLIPVAKGLLATFTAAPTPGRIARAAQSLRPTDDRAETVRWFLQPADHLLDAHLRDERLKAALAWLASQSGPPSHEPGTVGHLMWIALMHLRAPGRPVGGSGMLSTALAERLRRSGGELTLGDPATSVLAEAGRVVGVRTASGREVRARAVLSGAHVLATLDLLAAAGLEPPGARARIRVGEGVGAVVRLATTGLPRYSDGSSDCWQGMQLLVSDRRELRAAYADYLTGRPPADPAVLAITPTAVDPSLAPPGEHQVTLWAQWHRFDLADGRHWDGLREQVAETCIGALERHAPGFASTVRAAHVQTPLDLATELGLRGGNVMHVEMALDAMFALRPLPEFARYRAPVAGLYLTGASTHPGGGVFGASGRNAARTVLADLRHRRRRRN